MTLMKLAISLAVAAVIGCSAEAAEKYFAYNMTTSTDFKGVYLAPSGTTQWGSNQALNDKDKSLDVTERLTLTGMQPGIYDVRLVDEDGRACIKHGADLTTEKSFEIHDVDLKDCSH
jgi:hypothetical protein